MSQLEITFMGTGGRVLDTVTVAPDNGHVGVSAETAARLVRVQVRVLDDAPLHGSPQALAEYRASVAPIPLNWHAPAGTVADYRPASSRFRELAEYQFQLGLDAHGRVDPDVPRCGIKATTGTSRCNMRRGHAGTTHRLYGPCREQHGLLESWEVDPSTTTQEPEPTLPSGVVLGLPGL